jgi:hypothetical protein
MSGKKEFATKYHGRLPLFKYRNNQIYFEPIYPIKVILNKNVKYIKVFPVNILDFESNILYMGYDIYFKIINEDINNGLKVYIGVKNKDNISYIDKQKIVKVVEGKILKIMNNQINIELNNVTEYMNDNIDYSNDSQEDNSSNGDEYNQYYYQNDVDHTTPSYKNDLDYDDNNYDKFDNF